MTLFGSGVFADVIKTSVKVRLYWSGVGPSSNMTGVFVRRGDTETDTQKEENTT